MQPEHTFAPKPSEKRAYKRAKLRAARSGGTMYRGRWHSVAALQALETRPSRPPPRTARAATKTKQARITPVHCLSWNAGGLSSPIYQELLAWLDLQDKFRVVVIQETHWPDSCDFHSGGWFCIHSAGNPSNPFERYAGLLVLLSKKYFQDPAVHEVLPGRLLHVHATHKHTQARLDVVALYQHVWRTQLTTHHNRELRGNVWSALASTLGRLPSRNYLWLCGDFSSCLATRAPGVGPATLQPPQRAADPHLDRLVEQFQLCALNTWHAKPAHTCYGHTGKTQIDYVLTRRATAGGICREAAPVHSFPVARWRQSGHLPVQACMALLPVHWRADVAAHPSGVLDKQALNAAVISDDPQAAALREEVRATMAQVRATDLHQLHAQINSALCTAAAKVFPARRLADDRISAQAGFRASAKLTWQLYAAMRRPRLAAAKRILQKWRAAAAFHKASRQLREQSRALKKHAFQVKLAQAEAAAVKQDQRTLHQIVRSLSRAPRKQFSRLRDPEGRLLSKAAEAQALVDQGRLTYSLYPDLQLSTDMSDSLEVTDEELVAQLRAAKPGKAVPPHIAPAACWRLCADLIGPCLGTAMREHFRQGHPGLLHGDLTDATMAMLPKPGKPEHLLANLRPIGLMAPTSKSLAGVLRNRMLEWQLPHLVVRPQFAYVPNRGTMDALLRIHKHLDDAARLIRSNRVDRFGRHSGRKPLAFTGALSLSLDLSRAFDLTDRPSLFRALRDYQVPQAVVEVAQRLHFGARFVYKAGDYQAHFTPTNGLKQGCRLAPCLWVWCTLALMDTLESRLPQGWIDDILTLFADDCWGSWLLHSLSDLRKALSELAILLCTLEDYKMQINYSKTAVLLKFVGKQAKQALHEITVMKNGVRHLRLVVRDVERLIPIKDSHEYLGTKVTYDGPREANLTHRLQRGQRKFQMIQKALTGHHAITQEHRTRLWSACVRTSLHYSLSAAGLNEPDLRRLETRTLKHLRAILRLPAHKTHVSNAEIWQRSQVEPPGPQILQALISFRSKLEARLTTHPDITTRPGIMDYVRALELTANSRSHAAGQHRGPHPRIRIA